MKELSLAIRTLVLDDLQGRQIVMGKMMDFSPMTGYDPDYSRWDKKASISFRVANSLPKIVKVQDMRKKADKWRHEFQKAITNYK